MLPALSWSALANSVVVPGMTSTLQAVQVRPLSFETESATTLPAAGLSSQAK